MKQKLSHALLGLLLISISCTKDPVRPGSASLTLVNALVSGDTLVTNFKGKGGENSPVPLQWYRSALKVLYGEYARVSSYSGSVPLSLVSLSDTLHSLYSTTLNLPVGSMHTLFLTGNGAQVDTLFTTDVIPYYSARDTVTGVRFVNLSPGSAPIKITVEGGTVEALVSDLAYKGVTEFLNLPVGSSGSEYVFEVRDAVSDEVLATHKLDFRLYDSQTVVFYGTAERGFAMMQIEHFPH